jgi:SagB-type dehydrogenase family enzyme
MRRALGLLGALIAISTLAAAAPTAADIPLPPPRTDGGMPLMQALRERHSTREFSDRALSLPVLSDLLWAAAGINRPDAGKRTAPSARNWQEIEVYAVMQDGAYRYDAKDHALRAVAPGDLRRATGMQDFVGVAPLNLVFVADLTKMKDARPEDQALYTGADAAFMAENVYLFCASAGLATVVRGSVDRAALAAALGLPETQRIILAQTVGHPKAAAAE